MPESRDSRRKKMGFWRGKTVLVTGAGGFVGRALTRALLRRGAYVVALVRDRQPACARPLRHRLYPVRSQVQDLASLERIMAQFQPDAVIHLASQALVGPALTHPLETFETNIRGTYHMLEVCRRHGAKLAAVVIASSDKAYGECHDLPYRESHPLAGRHPYDVSKSCADLLAASYAHTYALPVTIARCGNIFGPGDVHFSRLVPSVVHALYHGQPPVLRSDGTPVRDFLYLADAVRAYLLLAQQARRPDVVGQAFNFSLETGCSVLEMVRKIAALMGVLDLAPRIEASATHEIGRQLLCADKARRLLGWSPRYTLDAALARTIEWYRGYFARTQGRARRAA